MAPVKGAKELLLCCGFEEKIISIDGTIFVQMRPHGYRNNLISHQRVIYCGSLGTKRFVIGFPAFEFNLISNITLQILLSCWHTSLILEAGRILNLSTEFKFNDHIRAVHSGGGGGVDIVFEFVGLFLVAILEPL